MRSRSAAESFGRSTLCCASAVENRAGVLENRAGVASAESGFVANVERSSRQPFDAPNANVEGAVDFSASPAETISVEWSRVTPHSHPPSEGVLTESVLSTVQSRGVDQGQLVASDHLQSFLSRCRCRPAKVADTTADDGCSSYPPTSIAPPLLQGQPSEQATAGCRPAGFSHQNDIFRAPAQSVPTQLVAANNHPCRDVPDYAAPERSDGLEADMDSFFSSLGLASPSHSDGAHKHRRYSASASRVNELLSYIDDLDPVQNVLEFQRLISGSALRDDNSATQRQPVRNDYAQHTLSEVESLIQSIQLLQIQSEDVLSNSSLKINNLQNLTFLPLSPDSTSAAAGNASATPSIPSVSPQLSANLSAHLAHSKGCSPIVTPQTDSNNKVDERNPSPEATRAVPMRLGLSAYFALEDSAPATTATPVALTPDLLVRADKPLELTHSTTPGTHAVALHSSPLGQTLDLCSERYFETLRSLPPSDFRQLARSVARYRRNSRADDSPSTIVSINLCCCLTPHDEPIAPTPPEQQPQQQAVFKVPSNHSSPLPDPHPHILPLSAALPGVNDAHSSVMLVELHPQLPVVEFLDRRLPAVVRQQVGNRLDRHFVVQIGGKSLTRHALGDRWVIGYLPECTAEDIKRLCSHPLYQHMLQDISNRSIIPVFRNLNLCAIRDEGQRGPQGLVQGDLCERLLKGLRCTSDLGNSSNRQDPAETLAVSNHPQTTPARTQRRVEPFAPQRAQVRANSKGTLRVYGEFTTQAASPQNYSRQSSTRHAIREFSIRSTSKAKSQRTTARTEAGADNGEFSSESPGAAETRCPTSPICGGDGEREVPR